MRRFRIVDVRTPWLWLVVFYRKQYGKPAIEASVYREHRHEFTPNWWFYWLTWEDEPPEVGQMETESRETWSEDGQRLTCYEGHSLL